MGASSSKQQQQPSNGVIGISERFTSAVTTEESIRKYAEWFFSTGTGGTSIISGPVGMDFFPNVLGRSFLIFKDVHTPIAEEERIQCGGPKIEDVLETVFKTNDEEMRQKGHLHDFFFEHSYVALSGTADDADGDRRAFWDVGRYKGTSILSVDLKFSECFKIDKRVCAQKYPQTRFHYIDYRFVQEKGGKVVKKSFLNGLTTLYVESPANATAVSTQPVSFSFYELLDLTTPLLLLKGFLRVYVSNFFDSAFEAEDGDENLKAFVREEIKKRIPFSIGLFYITKAAGSAEMETRNFRRRILKNVKGGGGGEGGIGNQIEKWTLLNVEPLVDEYEKLLSTRVVFEELVGGDSSLEKAIAALVVSAFKNKEITLSRATYKSLIQFGLEARRILIKVTSKLEMDAPTLGRMFKRSIVDANAGDRNKSRYVWFYGGRLHAEAISDFLEYVSLTGKDDDSIGERFSSSPAPSTSTSSRCIQMPYAYLR